jgi:hypothetical protein
MSAGSPAAPKAGLRSMPIPGGNFRSPFGPLQRPGPPRVETAWRRSTERALVMPEVLRPPWHSLRPIRIAALFVCWAVLFLTWGNDLITPLRLLVVVFHELGHAMLAVLSGGTVHSMVIHPDGSGLTLSTGGSRLLVLNGGYVGSIIGGLLVLLPLQAPGGARMSAAFLGLVLTGTSLFWFSQGPVGYSLVLVCAVLMLGMATRSPSWLAEWAMRLVGWMSISYAIVDLSADVFTSSGVTTDATLLEAATGIAAPAWGMVWFFLGGSLIWGLRDRLL